VGVEGVISWGLLVFLAVTADANDRWLLRYGHPAAGDIGGEKKRQAKAGKSNFIKQSLPLDNGRIGAMSMFNGGIGAEGLLVNEITCWGNAKRGLSEVGHSNRGVWKFCESALVQLSQRHLRRLVTFIRQMILANEA